MFSSEKCRELIQGVNNVTVASGLCQEDFVMEEASEFTKAVTKMHRHKGEMQDVIDEACDIMAATMVFFCRHHVNLDYVQNYCMGKWQRAIDRYKADGET